MYSMKHWITITVFLLVSSHALAANLYRYKNDQNILVIDDNVPPEYVHKGYDILNTSGRVIGRVPRALTAEELAAKHKAEGDVAEQARQREQDKRLLSIFSGPADAERARDRKLEALDVYINVTKGNILKLQGDFNNAQSQAAEKERAGQPVPAFLLESMDSLRRQIESAEASIREKQKEKADIRTEYAKDIERLRYLQAQKEKNAAPGQP